MLEQRGEASFEVCNRCKNGTPIWTEAQVTTFEHPDHGTVWASLHREIAERREARDALRISEGRFRTGIKRAPLVLFRFDRDLRCTWFFNNHVGFGGGQGAIGKTDVELFGPETGSRLSTINRSVLETGRGQRTDLVLELARGRATFDLVVEPLLGPDGEVQGVAGTAYDVSDFRR